eukprot:532388-Amphidinium_carterae.1
MTHGMAQHLTGLNAYPSCQIQSITFGHNAEKTILRIQIGDQVSSLQGCKRTWPKRLKRCWPMNWCKRATIGQCF